MKALAVALTVLWILCGLTTMVALTVAGWGSVAGWGRAEIGWWLLVWVVGLFATGAAAYVADGAWRDVRYEQRQRAARAAQR